jgi:hypothetical protein
MALSLGCPHIGRDQGENGLEMLTMSLSAPDPGCVKTRIVVDDAESCSAPGPEGIQSC